MPIKPIEPEQLSDELPLFLTAYGRNPVIGNLGIEGAEWQHGGPRFAWLRERKLLVEGEPLTPFTQAAMAGDVTSVVSRWGTGGLRWINADYTVTLSRLPDGPYIGLAAMTHSSDAGGRPARQRSSITGVPSAAVWRRR